MVVGASPGNAEPPPPVDGDVKPPLRATFDSSRGAMLRLVLAVVGVIGAIAFAHWITLPEVSFCTFQIATGRPCPGCGMTRSVVNLAQGSVLSSLRFHPLGVVMVGGLLAGLYGALMGVLRGHDPVWDFLERRGHWIATGFILALLVVWIVRAYVVPDWSPDPIREGAGWHTLLSPFF